MKYLIGGLLALTAFSAVAQDPHLSPDAPKDKPGLYDAGAASAVDAAIAPYVAQAKSTYPAAKARFLSGLPNGQYFFVTTRLHDKTGAFEQVFIAVASIQGGLITGRIASDINLVSGYKNGDVYAFPETELLDWLITHPDGSEEGNVVGKFLDGYHDSGA
jgi:hypothetical protein